MATTVEQAQRLVLTQDASKEVCVKLVRWLLDGFSLKSGDSLTLLSVLHQVNNPMGYKIRLDRSISFGANKKVIEEEIERKKRDYEDDLELVQISKLYEMQKIEFKIEVHAGPSSKIAALEAAKKLQPTWVILDRQLKKDKTYFLERLSCGISRMKRDNNIAKLRGPKPQKTGTSCSERRFSLSTHVSYDEMLPGSAEDEEDDLFSIELFPTNSASSQWSTESARSSLSEANSEMSRRSMKETTTILHEETNSIREKFPFESNGNSLDQKPAHISSSPKDVIRSMKPEEETVVDSLICTVCKNARPIIGFQSREFSYAKLHYATNRFSRENLVSGGEYEAVYRGKLKSRVNVAVKQQRDVISSIEEKKFKSEVQALEKMRHKNVVMLLGTYSGKNQRLLVYEYVCNGSLDQHISGQCSPLTWEARMKIAEGAARGLNYLHRNKIVHRDITPKNILLTHDFDPVLGGFGLARTLTEAEQTLDRNVVGTFGYLAPEYAESGKATTKTDVYSFGVVLLELITGRCIQDKRLEGKSLLQWARPLLKEMKCCELIDPQIASSHDPRQFTAMVQVTGNCLNNDPQKRLSMDEVISTLEAGTDERGVVRTIHQEKNASATPLPKQAKHFFL